MLSSAPLLLTKDWILKDANTNDMNMPWFMHMCNTWGCRQITLLENHDFTVQSI